MAGVARPKSESISSSLLQNTRLVYFTKNRFYLGASTGENFRFTFHFLFTLQDSSSVTSQSKLIWNIHLQHLPVVILDH